MLTLRYRGGTTIPLEAEQITPDGLRGRSLDEIARLPLLHGNAEVPLGEFFDVSGESDGDVRVEGDCSRVKWLGAGMTSGRLTIAGSAGMHVGAEMKGGVLEVFGNVGDWVGAEMKGGRLHVHGQAGHLAGAAYRGSRRGMTGGALLIDGDAGNEIGATMRRGLIAIGGRSGDFPGVSMIAGSIVLVGEPGIRPAAGMKRGTLVYLGSPPALLPSFRFDCEYQPMFLRLYLRQLRAWNFTVPAGAETSVYRRYSGDLVSLGKGEILLRSE